MKYYHAASPQVNTYKCNFKRKANQGTYMGTYFEYGNQPKTTKPVLSHRALLLL
jgi:hypothetical protein